MAMPDAQPGEPRLTDHEVIDDHRVKVGKVTDVIFDPEHARPQWATVKVGALGGEHLTPLEGAYLSEDGRLVLPYDKETVKHAPKAPRDHVLTPDLEAQLLEHYDLADR